MGISNSKQVSHHSPHFVHAHKGIIFWQMGNLYIRKEWFLSTSWCSHLQEHPRYRNWLVTFSKPYKLYKPSIHGISQLRGFPIPKPRLSPLLSSVGWFSLQVPSWGNWSWTTNWMPTWQTPVNVDGWVEIAQWVPPWKNWTRGLTEQKSRHIGRFSSKIHLDMLLPKKAIWRMSYITVWKFKPC